MAYFSASSSYSWNLSLKLVLISTGVLTMALALKVSAPVVSDFVVSEIPSIWSFLLSWLRPPYLYILINCIIISIFASSKLQPRPDDSAPEMLAAPPPPTPTPVKDVREDYVVYGNDDILSRYGYDTAKASVPVPVERGVDSEGVEKTSSNEILMNAGPEAVLPRSAWNGGLLKQDSLELLFSNNEKENEKPPVSARFAHRKPVKASPEAGKALGVSKPKRQETLETTWKTITEGRSMPLTRHLKKSDTWEPHMRHNNQPTDENTPPPKMKKCETFPDRTANSSPGSARLKREPSLSQDDLNRRVEAFIKKFNDEMRLQRQQSLNQYREMIRGGAQ